MTEGLEKNFETCGHYKPYKVMERYGGGTLMVCEVHNNLPVCRHDCMLCNCWISRTEFCKDCANFRSDNYSGHCEHWHFQLIKGSKGCKEFTPKGGVK